MMMMMKFAMMLVVLAAGMCAQPGRWTKERAAQWGQRQPWLTGANYIPATAINQLEMWQPDSFDEKRIDMELGWAEEIGMNTMRVFLHDLPWKDDPKGFRVRIDRFLAIAARHQIRPMLVLFDSCWDPFPVSGKQRAPKPGVHNSGWVQAPGARSLRDPSDEARLKAYVSGVVGTFAKDERVLAWDVWNEPSNTNGSSYGSQEPPDKKKHVERLLPKVFEWARAANPIQPLTSGVWENDWSSDAVLDPIARIQLEQSDVMSFHDYSEPAKFEQRIKALHRFERPILCTEYMARGVGSTIEGSMPIAKRYKVAAINWGLVQGKTQTHLPWDSWKQPYTGGREPAVWFHEVFRNDGSPYRDAEVVLIRRLRNEAGK